MSTRSDPDIRKERYTRSDSFEATSSTPSTDPQPQVLELSEEQRQLYDTAIRALEHSLGGNPKSLGAALDLAIYHCERARAFHWHERQVRKRRREVADSWDAVNKAAMKLAVHFEKLDSRIGSERLDAAIFMSDLQMRSRNKGVLPKAFAHFLRALAKQPRSQDCRDQIGPLGLPWSRKLPGREVVLTIVLAHSFHRVVNHGGSCRLTLLPNDKAIAGGSYWDVAALFAAAALGVDAPDSTAATKFLSEHSDCLIYRGWPEVKSV